MGKPDGLGEGRVAWMEQSSDDDQVFPVRHRPNVLVTGTPGTGKSATVEIVCEQTGARRLCVGEVVKEHRFHDGEDEHGALLIDEDPLLDWMEEELAQGGVVVEHHGSALFPERWFDAVVVLTTDNTLLYDRLVARGYPEAKVQSNVECEIMQVLMEEASESYAAHRVHQRVSDTTEQLANEGRDGRGARAVGTVSR